MSVLAHRISKSIGVVLRGESQHLHLTGIWAYLPRTHPHADLHSSMLPRREHKANSGQHRLLHICKFWVQIGFILPKATYQSTIKTFRNCQCGIQSQLHFHSTQTTIWKHWKT